MFSGRRGGDRVQSVHITTNVVSSNSSKVRCTRYHIMW